MPPDNTISKGQRKLSRLKQSPLVYQENFASVEVLQAAQRILPPVYPDHASVRDKQLAELRGVDQLTFCRWHHGSTFADAPGAQHRRIHVSLLPAVARQIFTDQIVAEPARQPEAPR